MRARTTVSTSVIVDGADYLNTSDATYNVGADVTWTNAGVPNVISMEIGTNATAANKPSNMFSFKYFDTGATVADVPSLQIEFDRVSSPEVQETQWPVTLMGFIFVPADTEPDFATHTALWMAMQYANTGSAAHYGHTVRTDDQTWSWTPPQCDVTAPEVRGVKQMMSVAMKLRGDGTYGAHYHVGTTNYPGTGGGFTNLYNTAKTTFHTLTSTHKIYTAIAAGSHSGGSGTRVVTGKFRYWVEK